MADIRQLARRLALPVAALIGGILLVTGITMLQQQRESGAALQYLAARQQLTETLAAARAFGLDNSEVADIEREQMTVTSGTMPRGTAPFNEGRINFLIDGRKKQQQLTLSLEERQAQLLEETEADASDRLSKLTSNLAEARRLGVEAPFLAPYDPLISSARTDFAGAATVKAYRQVAEELQAPLQKLSLLVSDQRNSVALIAQAAAQEASKNHGDITTARKDAASAGKQLQTDIDTASLFKMDVSIIRVRQVALQAQLSRAKTLLELNQVVGGLQVRDQQLRQAMNDSLPDKAITVSLKEQVLRAFSHGQQVFWTYVTTGRPGLETDPGSFKVYWKVAPWTMHSPWPKGSPYWYPDTKVQMVMWFNGGDGIHDSNWRAYYGPGTQYPHYDPLGDNNGSHGCVNVPPDRMPWLWDWTPTGTAVIVY